ncbi:hypothetical protein CC117_07050 [Parafrankia colletiae]|uniref:Uncharacterized protein n=1 Tax=Parafrankia colletiae TaxID=573497 RepID=A0A1S1QBS6_9ACTN|nr:hypothetical protein [Parafrankia colletiae]MCK9899676.1 hypothetical protein [Frankia sp. Cpl3]OHV30665.1 hypothetical protein CC117_07050 [Parafrankia colletiae]
MTAPTTGIPPRTTAAARAAAVLCEIAAPAVLVTALLVHICLDDAPDTWTGLLWAAISIAFGTIIPMAFVFHGVRGGKWSDHHVPERSRRLAPMLFGAASVTAGHLLLQVADAPTTLIAVYTAILVETLVLAAITKFWKISGHVAAAASCATVLTLTDSLLSLPAWLLVPLVAWARIQIRAARLEALPRPAGLAVPAGPLRPPTLQDLDELDGHTLAQTIAGALVATALVTATYLAVVHLAAPGA